MRQDKRQPRTSLDLHPGEQIRWSGQSRPLEGLFRKLPFGVGGLVIFVIASNKFMRFYLHNAIVEACVLSLFIVLSLWMMFYPVVEYRRAKQTRLHITNRRLIITKRNGKSTTSIRLSAIKQVERIRKRSSLTLRIPTALISDSEGDQKVDYTDLYGLQDGEEAYRLLTEHHA